MLTIWNKTDTLIYPNGKTATPEQVMQEFAFARYADTAIDRMGGITYAIENVALLLNNYGLNTVLAGQEAVDAINAYKAAQKSAEPPASAEERIAAALEYQIMATLPDETI